MILLFLVACQQEEAARLSAWDLPVRDVGPIAITGVIEDGAGDTWFEWAEGEAVSHYDPDADAWRVWFADELGGSMTGMYRDGLGRVCVAPSARCHEQGGWVPGAPIGAASVDWIEDVVGGGGLVLATDSQDPLRLYRMEPGAVEPVALQGADGEAWALIGGGVVWAGPSPGAGALSRWGADGRREVVPEPDVIWEPMGVDSEGRLLVWTVGGLLRWEGTWTTVWPATRSPVMRVHVTGSGVVWVVAMDASVWRLAASAEDWMRVPWPDDAPYAEAAAVFGDDLLLFAEGRIWRADTSVTEVVRASGMWGAGKAVWFADQGGWVTRLEAPGTRGNGVGELRRSATFWDWKVTSPWRAVRDRSLCTNILCDAPTLGLGWSHSKEYVELVATNPGFGTQTVNGAVSWHDGDGARTGRHDDRWIAGAVQVGDALWAATRSMESSAVFQCRADVGCSEETTVLAEMVTTSGHGFWFAHQGTLRRVSVPSLELVTVPDVGAVGTMVGDGEGGVWFTNETIGANTVLIHVDGGGAIVELVDVGPVQPERLYIANGRPWIFLGGRVRAELGGGVRPDYDVAAIRASVQQWVARRYLDGNVRTEPRFDLSPDGRLWFETPQGLAFLRWREGVPERPTVLPTVTAAPVVGAVTPTMPDEVWRARPSGVLRSTPDQPIPELYVQRDVFPALSITPFAPGEAWISFGPGGVAHAKDGELTYIDALAHDGQGGGVLDVSLVPGDPDGTAFVATQTGVARISRTAGRTEVEWLPDAGIYGAVDHVLAIDRDTVLAGLDAIEGALFPSGLIPIARTVSGLATRSQPRLVRLRMGEAPAGVATLDRGLSVLDLARSATNPDGYWIATTAGLYALVGSGDTAKVERVTAQGTLPPAPLHTLSVARDGTVWAAVDGQGDAPATIVGYRPDTDTVRTFAPEDGLPRAARIDFLSVDDEGWLVAGTNAGVVRGRVSVPGIFDLLQQGPVVGLVGLSLLGGVAASATIIRVSARRAARLAALARNKPVIDVATAFFRSVGREVRPIGDTVLEATDANAPPPRVLIHCTTEKRVPVEVVLAAFAATPPGADGKRPLAFLAYPLELDPAAYRQLDVYRLREDPAVIIPLAVPFAAAALADGNPRGALDGLLRRYLGFQDLFDTRTAVDEARFFYGRRSFLSEVEAVLSRGGHVALVGARKSGKTSVLMQLRQRFSSFPVVKVDLQAFSRARDGWPGDFLAEILRRYDVWGQARHGAGWTPAMPTELTGVRFQQALLERRDLRAKRGDTLPLVLLLDEMERIFPTDDPAQIDRYVEAMGALRAVAQEGAGLLAIVAADLRPTFTRVNQLGPSSTNPLYRFFQVKVLPTLDASECDAMLSEIGQAMGLDVRPEVRAAIYADAGGHPSLTRQLASAACRQRGGSSQVGADAYAKAIVWVRDGEGELDNFFEENLWGPSNELERRVLLAAARDGGATDAQLEQGLDADALSAMRDTRRSLAAMGLLTNVHETWHINGRLFREWLVERAEGWAAKG